MIKCNNLIKRYGKEEVVSNLSFEVKEGEVFGLLGANGAGKTTTIKMILGLTNITKGDIYIKDNVTVGYSPETPYFHPFLSGYEVMKFFAKLQKLPSKSIKEEIETLLEKVGLGEDQHKKVKGYSKGMKQRLAVAQALLGDPELLILDEPAAGLDALGRIEMLGLIDSLKKEGKTILLNSHILNDVERVADRVIILSKGKMIEEVDVHKLSKNGEEKLEERFIKSIGGM
ncbi:ABC transporter ATP-binding protein [Clostridium sp. D2Q-11]|uniref:ABC transporter ATP-binding protein n=1 Tax=Anaeromonas frigoriresistens TaxID=2683708 RepID=A0A942UX32_9FIRM|nr:ABC transporter ATP-binding protein [Anaeromonas frigoriresistens]MBS4538399.1 ABC transporter ATP-binding protein [Anaeromonas frigoriresistens]